MINNSRYKLFLYKTKRKLVLPKNSICLFMGSDYSLYLDVKKKAHSSVVFYDYSKLLQHFANYLKRPYIDFIGSLSIKNNSMAWWV